MNAPLSHLIELPLHPTPAQARTLLRLGQAHSLAGLLAMDQAYLAIGHQDVALTALVDGPDHPDRTPAGEAAALAATPLFADCPASTLEYAVSSYRASLHRCKVHNYSDLPGVGTSRIVAGHSLVSLAGPSTLSIGGVGMVRADLHRLPDWALNALRRGPEPEDRDASPAPAHTEIRYSGWAYIEREWVDGRWAWTVELDFTETW
ncbi:hypothetical protein GCM10010840_14790 [Deinococcus aerolatus]|uniref:Uncharacterized protein n=1 Tax=Deinococcus aerolatus TaxID=522487 RepID=A0ABQ2G6M2_9DEIO|nr:hypothetical protein [Deinococcus aerolatus]GGL77939.1 hypothetical protein GCM10010840_14790 [Deinococcus aerolatus]